MMECNTRMSVREEQKVSLETHLLADWKLDAFALGLFFSYSGHKLPRRYCFTLVQGRKAESLQVWKVLLFSPEGVGMDDQNNPTSKCLPGIVNFTPGFSGSRGHEAQTKGVSLLPYTAPFS